MKRFKQLICCLAATSVLSGLVFASEITLQVGLGDYDGGASTTIVAGAAADQNFGGLGAFLFGAGVSVERRGLLYFDLSHLTGTKVSDDAVLELNQANVRGFMEGMMEVGIYRISPANAGWKNGAGVGNLDAHEDEPSWNRHSGGSAGKKWAGSPGLSKPSDDYDPLPIAVFTYDAGNSSSVVRVSIPKEVIQEWIDKPESNAGMLFRRHSSSAEVGAAMGGFRSVRNIKPELRPKLIIKAQ
jgi:hypothetical protein